MVSKRWPSPAWSRNDGPAQPGLKTMAQPSLVSKRWSSPAWSQNDGQAQPGFKKRWSSPAWSQNDGLAQLTTSMFDTWSQWNLQGVPWPCIEGAPCVPLPEAQLTRSLFGALVAVEPLGCSTWALYRGSSCVNAPEAQLTTSVFGAPVTVELPGCTLG
jgi:hypothetical protein